MGRRKNKTIEEDLEIKSFTKKGHGLARYVNMHGHASDVEIPRSIPGEVVRAAFHRKRRKRFQGDIIEVIQASPSRVSPRCKHFTDCGGCRWQHFSYEEELRRKEEMIRKEFSPLLKESKASQLPIVPSSPPWRYRNKMEFSFSESSSGERFLGLMQEGKRGRVVDIEECRLANEWFTNVLFAVRRWWKDSSLQAYRHEKDSGSLRTLTVREGKRSGERMLVLTVSGNPQYSLSHELLNRFVATVREVLEKGDSPPALSVFLRIHQIKKGSPSKFYEWKLYGPEYIRERLSLGERTLEFSISPSSFFQPNTLQAEKIYSLAIEMAGISENDVVFDLYCATGTLGMLASLRAKKTIGIELSPESSLDARENIKRNHISNMEAITGDVGKTLSRLQTENSFEKADVVFVDPPRAGLDEEAISHIIRLSPSKIVYISCNPSSQAKNVQEFVKSGYGLSAIRPVDQFPHTVHVENIAVLIKS